MRLFGMSMQSAYQYVKERRPAISPNLNFMGQLVEFENCQHRDSQQLQLSDYAPSSEQDLLSEKMKTCGSKNSSKENTPEAARNSSEGGGGKVVGGDPPRFVLKLPASNKRRNKKVSPRTSPRIVTEDSMECNLKKPGLLDGDTNDEMVVKCTSNVPEVLGQLRRGCVEQAIKSFERLHSSDS